MGAVNPDYSDVIDCGQFTDAFFRFIAPALSSDGNPAAMDDREISGLPVTKPVASRKKKGKNRRVDIPEREESIPLFKERAKTLINAVCAEEISPTPDFQTCKYCDYWDFCKEGE